MRSRHSSRVPPARACVGVGDVVGDQVEEFAHLLHVGRVAEADPGRFVDHEHRVRGHLDAVPGHRDHGGDGRGDPVDLHDDVRRVGAQRVGDGDALEH
jgi:hypothetical protein